MIDRKEEYNYRSSNSDISYEEDEAWEELIGKLSHHKNTEISDN